jgi:predicted nuclease with TOPRIM domain
MPTIRNLIQALYSWTAKWGDNWNLSITKGVKIPFEKYLKFREDYDRRSKLLEDVIGKESENLFAYNEKETALLTAKSKISELEQQVTAANEFKRKLYDFRLLDGNWTNKYSNIKDNLNGEEEIRIEKGKYYIIGRFGEETHAFNIKNFHFDSKTRSIFFIKEVTNPKLALQEGRLRYYFNQLIVTEEDLLDGTENGTTSITYKKRTQK